MYNAVIDNNRKFEYFVYPDIKLIPTFTVQKISKYLITFYVHYFILP